MLNRATTIFFDATFKVVPQLYYQLFTIFVPSSEYIFPAIFALMTRKTSELYTAIFYKIHTLAPQFAPTKAMADFEDASVRGLHAVYGDQVQVSGCWFHYAQAVGKKAKKIGLTNLWRESASVKKAYVP